MVAADRLVVKAASGGHRVLIGGVVIGGVGATEFAKGTSELACCAVGSLPLSREEVALWVRERRVTGIC